MDDGQGAEVGLFGGDKEFWKLLRGAAKAELDTDAGRVNLRGLIIVAGMVLVLASSDLFVLIVHEINPSRSAPNDPIEYLLVFVLALFGCMFFLTYGSRR